MNEKKIREEVLKGMNKVGLKGFTDFPVIDKVIDLAIQETRKVILDEVEKLIEKRYNKVLDPNLGFLMSDIQKLKKE